MKDDDIEPCSLDLLVMASSLVDMLALLHTSDSMHIRRITSFATILKRGIFICSPLRSLLHISFASILLDHHRTTLPLHSITDSISLPYPQVVACLEGSVKESQGTNLQNKWLASTRLQVEEEVEFKGKDSQMSSKIDGKGGGHHHQRQASLPTAPLGIETEDDPSVGVGTIIPSGLVGSPDTLSMRKSMTLRGGNLPLSTSVGRPAVNFGSISVGGPSVKAGSPAVVGDSLAASKLSLSKPAFKRVQSVVGIESFNNIQPAPDAAVVAAKFGSGLTAGGGGGGEFGHMMDDRARSQLAQNVW